MDQLAILGGPKAFTHSFLEKWERPREREKASIADLIDRNELSGSGFGASLAFEKEFARYIGCRYCLAFSHGTAALMAAYYAAGIGPGDEVLTPGVGYIASYAGALHMGARPIFCDIDSRTLLIDPTDLKKKITPRSKAINITHLNGRVCDLEAIFDISEQFGLPIIDDASHAHGAEWKGKKLGDFEHTTCFSLQGANPLGKPVSGGEGGVACTNNKESYQKMLAYCHLHRKNLLQELKGSPFEQLDSEALGLKWRPHPLAMALASISLESLDERNAKRLANFQRVIDCLKPFDFLSFPDASPHSKMGGFYGGLKAIYDPSRLNHLSFDLFLQALIQEGAPIIGVGVGSCEYRRALFSKGFDLWGKGRSPIKGAWLNLASYQPTTPADFPVAERMDRQVFSLSSFIEVEEDYYPCLAKAFEKLQTLRFLLP